MRRLAVVMMAAASLLALAQNAQAQFGAPVQKPAVDPAGSLLVYPTLGIVHDEGVTEFALMARARYSLMDELSVNGQLGGLLGDYNAFALGAGGKFQFMKSEGDNILELSVFTMFDLSIHSKATEFDWLVGPLCGARFEADSIAITPYAGLGLGVIYWKPENFDGEADFAVNIIFGGDVGITEELSAFTEFAIGPTDEMPILSWHLGVSYNFTPPGTGA